MIVPNNVRQWHDQIVGPAGVVQAVVRDLVEPYCAKNHFRFSDRIKDVQSCAEKMESGRYASMDAMDDVYAGTIVIPTLERDDEVVQYLTTVLAKSTVKGRTRAGKDPEVFRFDSTRFYGTLKPSSLVRDPRVDRLLFEIQVQSAFENAWVTVTHDSVYKGAVVDWRRKRLGAILKAAVEQLDLLVLGFDDAVENLDPSYWEAFKLRTDVLDLMRALGEEKRIDEVVLPVSWTRFADNVVQLCESEARARSVRTRDIVARAKTVLARVVRGTGWSCPRSLSLFQTVFGVLVTEKVVGPLPAYLPVAGDEVSAVFPAVKDWLTACG